MLNARLDPLTEFHRAAIPTFNQMLTDAKERILDTFVDTKITKEWRPADARLDRPTATWTYMVHDEPFDSEMVRMAKALRPIGKRARRHGSHQ